MKIKTFIIIALSLLLITCKEEDPAIPNGTGNQIIIEQTADSVSYWDALYNGTISNLNKRTISQYGHCWDTIPNPDLSKNKTLLNNTDADIEFSSTLDSLQPDVNYYIRSYFILETDTAYSTESNFTTLAIQKATIIRNAEPETELYTAILQGKITDTGGEIINKGFYYSSNSDVSQTDSLILNTSENFVFTDTLKNLLPNKTYYVKAFASNRVGISFSTEFQFTTKTKTAELTTTEPTDILAYSCKTGGTITDDFGSDITQRGVCYSKNPMPTINDSLTTNGTGNGAFESEITELQPNTNYYIRAHAVNEKGVAYGNELSFKTEIGLPAIETNEVLNIMAESATCGGTITNTGGDAIIEKGVCWNLIGNPTIDDEKTQNGTGSETFESSLTNLSANTTYYVKAYVQNSMGLVYGDELSLTTKTGIPTLITTDISEIHGTTALGGGEVLSENGMEINSRGLCWSTQENPTLADFSKEAGQGTGSFVCDLTSLLVDTTYYVSTYAINSLGVYYGEQKSFRTLKGDDYFVDNRDGNQYRFVSIGNQIWMAENLAYLPSVNLFSDIPLPSSNELYYYVHSYEGTIVSEAKSKSNYKTYGVLYNWAASNTSCPTGWHLPSDAEFSVLTSYITNDGYASSEGKALKANNGWFNDGNGSDIYGFEARPGGTNTGTGTSYRASFWSSTPYDSNNGWYRSLSYTSDQITRDGFGKQSGFSVRCLKD